MMANSTKFQISMLKPATKISSTTSTLETNLSESGRLTISHLPVVTLCYSHKQGRPLR